MYQIWSLWKSSQCSKLLNPLSNPLAHCPLASPLALGKPFDQVGRILQEKRPQQHNEALACAAQKWALYLFGLGFVWCCGLG